MLAKVIASIVAGEAGDVAHRMRISVIFYILVALAALCGVGFLVGAFYVAAAQRWGSFYAAIYFGIGFLVLAVLIFVWQRIALRGRRRRTTRRRAAETHSLAGTVALVLLPSLLARKGAAIGILVPILAAAGYAIYRENREAGNDQDGHSDEPD